MTSAKQKDLTRADALALAKAKWGTTDLVFIGEARDGSWSVCRSFMSGRSPMHHGATLREACEKAGLLPLQAKARELEGGK
jgi:hypothetical protein